MFRCQYVVVPSWALEDVLAWKKYPCYYASTTRFATYNPTQPRDLTLAFNRFFSYVNRLVPLVAPQLKRLHLDDMSARVFFSVTGDLLDAEVD